MIEYRQRIVTCACGCVHRGVFPFGVTPHVSYGPRLKAYAVGLVDGHFVALGPTAEILADQYGVRPSDGTIQNWVGQAAEVLRPAYERIRQGVIAADLAHFDESGVRVTSRTQWLHVAGTTGLAFYTIHAKRGLESMTAEGILPKFIGYAVHDPWAPYFHFTQVTHSLCSAHLLRELRYFEEAPRGHRFRVPFDNNLAERLVRPIKVKLKVAGGFRAVGGSASFCTLRSIWQTNKLKGINPFQTLRIAFAEG